MVTRVPERGVLEATLRGEIPRPGLIDLLDLTALIAFKQPERYSRLAGRWLLRYLQAVEDATIHDVFLHGFLPSGARWPSS
jgi:hypothetical protein